MREFTEEVTLYIESRFFLKKHCAKYEDKNLAKNYRPTSVLPTLSKVFEKIIQKQVINYVNTSQGLN